MSVIKKEAYFLSSTGINKIRTCIWQKENTEYKGIFQIAHGVSEHIDRYDEFARFLAEEGYVVCGNDHLGHGKSVDSFEDFGFFAEEDGDNRMIDDMHILYSIMHKRYPELPYYLFGHSMGSFCARVYASAFGIELSGLVICGTGDMPQAMAVLEEPVKLLCRRLGAKATVPASLLDKVSTIGISGAETPKDWLSCNKENVMAYINDPLCGNDLKLGGVRDILSLANTCSSSDWASCLPVELPVLIISGAKDPIGLNGKGVIAVCDKLEEAGIEPKIILYPGMRHEILNEDEREKVYTDILDWLKDMNNL